VVTVGVWVDVVAHTVVELSPVAVTNILVESIVSPLPSAPYVPWPAQRVSPVVQEITQAALPPTAIVPAGLESKRTAVRTLAPVAPLSCVSWLL
jgi:hypothetical protein